MTELLETLRRIFSYHLFRIGSTDITLTTLLVSLAVLIGSVWLARVLRNTTQRALNRRGARPDVVGSVSGLLYYCVLILGFGATLSTAGIEVTAMFAAGAVFAVGIGFAMQSIAQNFVAGLILLGERSIKPGDLLEVEGKLVKVVEMGIRSCIAQSRDGEDHIIPNSVLIQTTVKNFTLRETTYRVWIEVGVVYSSDMTRVREALLDAARKASLAWSSPAEPTVLLTEFGSSSVNWEVGLWMNDPWERRLVTSDLYLTVWNTLKERGIIIAFPQVDLHLDPPVTAALESLAGRAA